MDQRIRIASARLVLLMAGLLQILVPLTPASAEYASGATFTRITTGELVNVPGNYTGSWGDYDDDGWLDVFFGSGFASTTNHLYHNDRDGTFSLIDQAAMPKSPSNQHGSAWGDYDNDGHLDLIVTSGNPELAHNMLYHNNGDGTFSWDTDNAIYADFFSSFHGASWGDYDNDGFIDLALGAHDSRNRLFHNEGAGSFTQILNQAVVTDPTIQSYGRSFADYDDDGDLDLLFTGVWAFLQPGGFVPSNALYRNDGAGTFTRVHNSGINNREERGLATCWADYDNDGRLDLFVANESTTGIAPTNSLFHNEGGGRFTRVANSAPELEPIEAGGFFGVCAWADYDNDGFIDLLIGSDSSPSYLLYHNNGDRTFTKITQGEVVTGPAGLPSWGDYDNDGFLDIFGATISQYGPPLSPNVLYHNDGNSNAWLNVKLIGITSNRSAIGAKVRIKAFYRGETRWQMREISGGDSQNNQQSLNAEFGLADATRIEVLRIEWPSGKWQEIPNVSPNQFLTVPEVNAPGEVPEPGVGVGVMVGAAWLAGAASQSRRRQGSQAPASWAEVRATLCGPVTVSDRVEAG